MLLIEVGVDQLGVGGVDDGGPVGGCEDVLGPVGLQGPQRYGLGAQAQALALRQCPCGCIHVPADQTSVKSSVGVKESHLNLLCSILCPGSGAWAVWEPMQLHPRACTAASALVADPASSA